VLLSATVGHGQKNLAASDRSLDFFFSLDRHAEAILEVQLARERLMQEYLKGRVETLTIEAVRHRHLTSSMVPPFHFYRA
jgi:hypothetical protein